MTPKEKAEELHVEYWYLTNDERLAKKCALIAVDEILDTLEEVVYAPKTIDFWQQVKQEIEKY